MAGLKRSFSITESSQSDVRSQHTRPFKSSGKIVAKTRKPITLQQKVKAMIERKRETKQWQWGVDNAVLTYYVNAGLFATNNVLNLSPNATDTLVQGTGNSDRIGNKISVKSASLKIVIYPNNYDGTVNSDPGPIDVRFIVLHSKATPTAPIVSATFFESNNGTQSPQDILSDMVTEVNKDIYVVSNDFIRKVGTSNYGGTSANASRQYFANNDYKFNQIIDLDVTKAFPKTIVWNDTGTTPTSFMPTLVMLPAKAEGSAVAATEYQPLRYHMQLTLKYHDN